jgi:hypothetical protein
MCDLQVREEQRSDAPEGARGNHLGAVGVVFVMQRDGRPVKEIKNILAELAGLYYVVGSIAAGHDLHPWFTTTTASPSG